MARRNKLQQNRTPAEWLLQQRDAWPELAECLPEPWRLPLFVVRHASAVLAYKAAKLRMKLRTRGAQYGDR